MTHAHIRTRYLICMYSLLVLCVMKNKTGKEEAVTDGGEHRLAQEHILIKETLTLRMSFLKSAFSPRVGRWGRLLSQYMAASPDRSRVLGGPCTILAFGKQRWDLQGKLATSARQASKRWFQVRLCPSVHNADSN